ERLVKLGEDPDTVHVVGCPRMDLVADVLAQNGDNLSQIFQDGVGGTCDLERQIALTLEAVQQLGLPAIVLWPNADAGSEDIARGIRKFREHEDDARLHFFKNLPTYDYVKLMEKTSVLVGNS